MKVRIYSVYDRKGQLFNQPFFAANDAMAVRTIYMREKVDPGLLSEFPEDFLLVYIGEFDSDSGDIKGLDHKFDTVSEVRNILKERSDNDA